jgi:hypothetical protein
MTEKRVPLHEGKIKGCVDNTLPVPPRPKPPAPMKPKQLEEAVKIIKSFR